MKFVFALRAFSMQIKTIESFISLVFITELINI